MPDLASLKFIEDIVINPAHCIRLYVDPNTGERFIAKVLSPSSPTNQQRETLIREYEIASNLKGKSHVKPLSIEYQGLDPVLFYEDFSGVSVQDMLHQGPLEAHAFFQTAIALCEALEEIHQQFVAHQDIKPSNIMVNLRAGEFRFNDFSLAKKWTRKEEKWIAGGQGSLKYISPEQTGRIDAYIDYRTDFYSLGATFYMMLTGEVPFESDDPGEIMHAHIARLPKPPHKNNPHIPEQLSLIILKMMAKSPTDRYKSALGIKNDLSRCFLEWEKNKEVPLFPLGEEDKGGILEITSHFYGRDEEFNTITKMTREKGRTFPLMVMVGGQSGSGKTSFIREVINKIELNDGYFLTAKYDQYQQDRPLSAMLSAFSQLFEKIHQKEGERTKGWLKETFGDNLPAMTQLMPSLELMMGAQGEAVEVSPAEAQNRFAYNLSKVIELKSSEDNPIILFLDNLQWADDSSLHLLYSLLTNNKCPGLIVLAAYRNSDVDLAHPLSQTIQKIQNEGVVIKNITLGPLEVDATTKFLAETLERNDEKLNALATKIHVKAGGNPLLTEQLISTLYDEEIINFDPSKQQWDWDNAEIAKVQVNVQVVDLAISKMGTLSEETKKMLFLAASFGNEINLDILTKIMQLDKSEVISHAEKALGLGLIDLSRKNEGFILIFSHPRFREACYQILPEEKATEEQKLLGLALIDLWDKKGIQEHIFEITNLLNQVIPILDEKQKMLLVQYNLNASQKAVDSFAYRQGLDFAEMGISLLPKDPWKQHYSIMFQLCENAITASGELKDDKKIHAFYKELEKNAKDIIDTASSLTKVIHYHYNIGDFEGTLQLAREFFKKVNYPFPAQGSKLTVLKEYVKARFLYWWKIGRGDKRPELTDRRIIAIQDVTDAIVSSVYFFDLFLWTSGIFRQYQLNLIHGKAKREVIYLIGFFYIGRAAFKDFSLPKIIFDDIKMDEYKRYPFYPVLALSYCGGLRHFVPLVKFVKATEGMFLHSLSMGNVVHSSFLYMYLCTHQFSAGFPITKCQSFINDYKDLNKKMGIFTIEWASISIAGIYDALVSGEEYSAVIEGTKKETDALFDWLHTRGMNDQYFHLAHLILLLKLVHGRDDDAWKYSRKGAPFRQKALATPFKEHFMLYEVMAIGSCYNKKDKKEQKLMEKICKANIKELEGFVKQQKENYEYKYWMAMGEYERILQNLDNAHFYYRKGILLAMENGFFQDTAIALERLGKMMLLLKDSILARIYFKQSIDFYERWGAEAKVTEMNEEYSELISQQQELFFDMDTEISTSASSSQISEFIDTQAYIGAAEAITEEIDLENLIKVLVGVVMKNAGADHVVLLTVKEDEWTVTAEKKSGDKEVTFLHLPLNDASDKVPLRVVGEVIKSKEDVVIKNASKESKYSQDPYIMDHGTLSILCLPLTYQNNMVATLYMENSLTKGAFTEQRVQNILLLSSHIANALENALLYEELKKYSKDLESKVEQRTKEITQKNDALIENNEALNLTLEKLKQTQNQLIASEKLASLGELTSGIAHEIRNPLNFINNFSSVNIEMLEENNEAFQKIDTQIKELEKEGQTPEIIELQEKGKQLLEDFKTVDDNQKKILKYGNRSEKIISLMEQHSKVGTGALQKTKLSDLIEEALVSSKLSFHERYSQFTFSVEKDYDDNATGIFLVQDEMAFVFYNIIKNALEAMQEKSTQEEGYQPVLAIQTKRVDDMVEMTIKDNGVGIPEEEQDKVFNPFFTSKPTGQAIGLALSISHSIVNSIHHGIMTITSKPGEYTEIKIIIPMVQTT